MPILPERAVPNEIDWVRSKVAVATGALRDILTFHKKRAIRVLPSKQIREIIRVVAYLKRLNKELARAMGPAKMRMKMHKKYVVGPYVR